MVPHAGPRMIAIPQRPSACNGRHLSCQQQSSAFIPSAKSWLNRVRDGPEDPASQLPVSWLFLRYGFDEPTWCNSAMVQSLGERSWLRELGVLFLVCPLASLESTVSSTPPRIQHWHPTLAFSIGIQQCHALLAFIVQSWQTTLTLSMGIQYYMYLQRWHSPW